MGLVMLRNTDIQTTTLGFGCAGLMRVSSAKRRQRLLSEVFAAGVRHFDVAPAYGLGKVEAEVGAFARGRRDQLVLATKFGLQVRRASGVVSAMQGVARTALAMIPALRRAVRKRAHNFYAKKDFGVAAAKRSLEDSLRALRTDYVDIFLLHEPEFDAVRDTAVWEYLARARDEGLIRAWGVAGYPAQIGPIGMGIPELMGIVQMPNDVVGHQLDEFARYTQSAFITFSPFSEVYDSLRAFVEDNTQIVERFIGLCGLDPQRDDVLAKFLLSYCLRANPVGVTLFFTSRVEGVAANVAAWKDPVPESAIRAFEDSIVRAFRDGVRIGNERQNEPGSIR